MAQGNFQNLILRNLDPESIDRLGLRPVTLELRQVLEQPGGRIEQILFIEEGIGSMTTSFADGSQVESGMFGIESVIGTPALMGVRNSINHIAVQVSGHGYVASLDNADREFRRYGVFHDLAVRFVLSQTVQSSQSAGCNARHNVQQRLSRWLLQCRDRVTSDVVNLTQEFMAAMLGVERPAVSIVAGRLQDRGLIEYTRGRLRIADRLGLQAMACECYGVTKRELDAFQGFAETNSRVEVK